MNHHHQLFLKWLIIAVLTGFGVVAASYFGLIQLMVSKDISLISALIMLVAMIMFVYLGTRTSKVSKELNLAEQTKDVIESCDPEQLVYETKDDDILVSGKVLPKCAATEHIANLMMKAKVGKSRTIDQTLLLEDFSDCLHEKSAIGWMVSQKLTNLGLLGTAIGFVVALMAFFGVSSLEFAAMKTILSDVSVGMSVALYTTITAMVAAIPIELKTYFIERGNNQLVSMVTKITEIYVVPALEKANEKKPNKR